MKNCLRIAIFGKPASGKGTQARLLVGKLKLPEVASGNILRQEIQKKTKIGKLAGQMMNRKLTLEQYQEISPEIDQFLVDKILKHSLTGFILDGVPRNLNQAKLLEKKKIHLDFLVVINISDRIVLSRLTGRRLCSTCGAVYHLVNDPPKKSGLCDQCGGQLFQRADDREEYVKFRLEIYHRYTEQIIDYYRNRRTVIIEINGEQSIENIFEEICRKIKELASE